MSDGSIAADDDVVLSGVHGVVRPLLQGDDGALRTGANEDRDDLGQARRALVREDDGDIAVGADADEQVAPHPLRVRADEADPHRVGNDGLGRDLQVHHATGVVGVGDGEHGGPVLRRGHTQGLGGLGRDGGQGDAVGQVRVHGQVRPRRGVPQQRADPIHGSEPPLLLAARRHREVRDVERRSTLGARLLRHHGGLTVGVRGRHTLVCLSRTRSLLQQRHQPTAPSICSSMSRLSSRAYSMGSSRAIGSTKPRTIIAIASSSVIPRDMR
jgi:hypothetical protein